MTQATTWGVPRNSGEADLSEDAWAVRADESLDALLSCHKGSAEPTYKVAGTFWIDDAATPWVLKFFDGAAWREVMSINATAGKIQHRWYKGADVASATALVLGGDGNYFDVTGTAAITSIGSIGIGSMVVLHFDGAATLTHHATNLILPGGANVTTAAGDEAIFIEYASGTWRCVSYQKADGTAIVTSAAATLPRSYLAGLALANGADANNDIDVAAGECRDSSDTADMVLASTLVKQLDASWAVGSAAGGLDTGSKATSTWYHVYLIKRSDTGVVDALFSLSASTPTMPTNYDLKRRIGSIYTDGSGNILGFVQTGDHFQWQVPHLSVSTSGLGASAALYTMLVPTGFKVLADLSGWTQLGVTVTILLSDPDTTDTAPSLSGRFTFTNGFGGGYGSFQKLVGTDTSAQIRARSDTASTALYITVVGWFDRRGRDD